MPTAAPVLPCASLEQQQETQCPAPFTVLRKGVALDDWAMRFGSRSSTTSRFMHALLLFCVRSMDVLAMSTHGVFLLNAGQTGRGACVFLDY